MSVFWKPRISPSVFSLFARAMSSCRRTTESRVGYRSASPCQSAMLRVVASKVSALTVTLMAVIPELAMASRCFCDSGPRGGHETFIEPGLASASMTMERS